MQCYVEYCPAGPYIVISALTQVSHIVQAALTQPQQVDSCLSIWGISLTLQTLHSTQVCYVKFTNNRAHTHLHIHWGKHTDKGWKMFAQTPAVRREQPFVTVFRAKLILNAFRKNLLLGIARRMNATNTNLAQCTRPKQGEVPRRRGQRGCRGGCHTRGMQTNELLPANERCQANARKGAANNSFCYQQLHACAYYFWPSANLGKYDEATTTATELPSCLGPIMLMCCIRRRNMQHLMRWRCLPMNNFIIN